MGLNAALAVAGRSLEVFTAGIQVSGQNISNAATPGYVREEIAFEPGSSYQQGTLILGTGSLTGGIRQQIDQFLEGRLYAANTELNSSMIRETIYKQLEGYIRELGTGDLSTSLSGFLAAVHDVINQPESNALRKILVDRGTQFGTDIADLRAKIDETRTAQSVSIETLVQEANTLIRKIDELNPRISTLEAGGLNGSEAGEMRSERYAALNRLSEILPIRFRETEDGTVDVFTTNNYLVLGSSIQELETFVAVDRGVQVKHVRLNITQSVISDVPKGGELRGIIESRDQILGGFVDDLDQLAAAVIQEFNRIHSSGEGLEGFQSVTAFNAVQDTTAVLNSTAAGLKFPPQHGSFQIKVKDKISGLTQTTTLNVDLDGIGSDTTLDSLRTAINAIGNVTASITTDGKLKIDTASNFEIRFGDDSSGALSALGINTFFTGFDSASIGVNQAVASNHNLLATGQGAGPSDSTNIVRLAEFSRNQLSSLGGVSLEDFYETTVAAIGQASAAETAITDGLRAFQESLQNQREQFSGVSLDEEAIKMLQFQHAFAAAARMISTVDELFSVLLTI